MNTPSKLAGWAEYHHLAGLFVPAIPAIGSTSLQTVCPGVFGVVVKVGIKVNHPGLFLVEGMAKFCTETVCGGKFTSCF